MKLGAHSEISYLFLIYHRVATVEMTRNEQIRATLRREDPKMVNDLMWRVWEK